MPKFIQETKIELGVKQLQSAYKKGDLTPTQVVDYILERSCEYQDHNIWITLLKRDQIASYIDQLTAQNREALPLWGIPFAIKDNIDLAGVPTTAACPDYRYIPDKSAFVVEQLIAAGAIPIGKTNLDQFATGLVGTRSPFGACKNSIKPEMISGGSSSGSAVAVGLGLASFSLGTDTAGSGRIPAFLNNLVGVKPTVGTLSASGMVPACRTLDTISIFTHTVDDAESIFQLTAVYDEGDDYARVFSPEPVLSEKKRPTPIKIGVPAKEQLEWFGNEESKILFSQSLDNFSKQGASIVTIDFSPFQQAANLLYAGPWVAERYAALEEIMKNRPEILHPVTRNIVSQAENYSAVDCFKAAYQLQAYKKAADKVLAEVDCIVTPTAGTHYSIAELEADPVQLNTNLGYYTNFMNLLDYSALAIPSGFYSNDMPFGVTLFGPAFSDLSLMSIAKGFE